MIPQETVALIQETARIEEVVGDFVTLKRRGANFTACCPFHNEKTPSFYVSPSKGMFKCFGCGKGGSAVSFVMDHEHMTYSEALKYLAKKYHIEVQEKEESAEDIAARQRTESLMLVTEFAQNFFREQLSTPEGRALGYAYYRARGVEDEWMDKFGLGWAPKSRSALTDAALAKGYKEEYLIAAGLTIKGDDGRLRDKFFERVTFPIYSVSGRVIAFSCRTLSSDKNVAKYVNSPETEIYIKSKSLFGISQAKNEMSRQDRCILVEGNLDVVSMHQAGITNVVASCGTSLTSEQIRLIKRFTQNVTVMYDDDAAGIHAAVRAIGMILAEGMNVKLVLLPDGDDPDSYCRKHTLEEVRAYIGSHEQDFVSFMADMLLGSSKDPGKRAEVINSIAEDIALMPDAVGRSVYVDACARRFGIDEGVIFQKIRSTRMKHQDDEFARAERERRREEAGLAPVALFEKPEAQEAALTMDRLISNKVVAKSEEDLLYFLLTHGTDELDFPTDSEYYSGSEEYKPTVADFIRGALEEDGTTMLNAVYQRVYDAYMDAYDEGLEQDGILRKVMEVDDRELAYVASQLSMEKYEITVKNFSNSLTATSSWLATFVPNAIMVFMERRVENDIQNCTQELSVAATGEEQEEILRKMMKLQAFQKRMNQKLGRDKKK